MDESADTSTAPDRVTVHDTQESCTEQSHAQAPVPPKDQSTDPESTAASAAISEAATTEKPSAPSITAAASNPTPRRYSALPPPSERICANCNNTDSPQWRLGPNDSVLCNACGLYYKKWKRMPLVHERRRTRRRKRNSDSKTLSDTESTPAPRPRGRPQNPHSAAAAARKGRKQKRGESSDSMDGDSDRDPSDEDGDDEDGDLGSDQSGTPARHRNHNHNHNHNHSRRGRNKVGSDATDSDRSDDDDDNVGDGESNAAKRRRGGEGANAAGSGRQTSRSGRSSATPRRFLPDGNGSASDRVSSRVSGRGKNADNEENEMDEDAKNERVHGLRGRGQEKVDGRSTRRSRGEDLPKKTPTKGRRSHKAYFDGCQVCLSGARPAQILLCDLCDHGYHLGCLTPALTEVPPGDWFCPECTDEPWSRSIEAKKLLCQNCNMPSPDFDILPSYKTSDALLICKECKKDPKRTAKSVAESLAKLKAAAAATQPPVAEPSTPVPNTADDTSDKESSVVRTLSGRRVKKTSHLINEKSNATNSPVPLIPTATQPAGAQNTATEEVAALKPEKKKKIAPWPYHGGHRKFPLWKGPLKRESITVSNVVFYFQGDVEQIPPWNSWPTSFDLESVEEYPEPQAEMEHYFIVPKTSRDDASFNCWLVDIALKRQVYKIQSEYKDFYIIPISTLLDINSVTSAQHNYLLAFAFKKENVKTIAPRIEPTSFDLFKQTRFSLLGYDLLNPTVSRLIELAVSFGASFVHYPQGNDVDVIMVHPKYLSKLHTNYTFIQECKLNSKLTFLLGTRYLEDCMKTRILLDPTRQLNTVLPKGGVLLLDGNYILARKEVINLLLNVVEKYNHGESYWVMKLQSEFYADLEKKARDSEPIQKLLIDIKQALNRRVFLTTEIEAPAKSNSLPALICLAHKMAYLNVQRFRHVILVTNNTLLQAQCKEGRVLAMDCDGLTDHFRKLT